MTSWKKKLILISVLLLMGAGCHQKRYEVGYKGANVKENVVIVSHYREYTSKTGEKCVETQTRLYCGDYVINQWE